MLYIGYLIILDGQSMTEISFGNFHFCPAEARKLHKQAVRQTPWEPPSAPPPPNTQGVSKTHIEGLKSALHSIFHRCEWPQYQKKFATTFHF